MWARRTYHEIADELSVVSDDFRLADQRGDQQAMVRLSVQGVELLRSLALALRSEQDYGGGARSSEPVGDLLEGVANPAFFVLTLRSIPAAEAPRSLSLREALNKIAHADPSLTSYKLGVGRHDLILSGVLRGSSWVAVVRIPRIVEILRSYPDEAIRR